MPRRRVGPNLFACSDCGYAAEVGAGSGWSTCPQCGGNQVTLSRPGEQLASTTAETDAPPEGEEEE